MPQLRRGRIPAANRIFVDREAPQRIFEEAAFAIPADRSIIRVFYGVGGQGKTALCRELMRRTNAAVEPSFAFLRRAELDLHGRSKEDPDRLLVWIRNGFAGSGIGFPCFDLAFAIAWEATRGDEPLPVFTRQWLSRATAVGKFGVDETASAVKDLLSSDAVKDAAGELVGSIPGIGFALKRIGNWSIEKGKRFYLEKTQEALKELYDGGELKKPYELSRLLPWMLAQDLNAHLRENLVERFVLFVDEYERVFDEAGAGSKWEENPFDGHMRVLLAETNGLLTVFFSREQLPWNREPQWRGDLDGHQHLLGGLADKDADAFLRAIPIDDDATRQAIIAGARETTSPEAPIYPLMLDLQVEHWGSLRAAGIALEPERFALGAASFEDRRIEIVRRVLRDYGTPLGVTLERLSVAQRFDRKAFQYVVKTFGTALPLDQFDRLADLSFVTKAPDGFLSIHNLVAETIRETLAPEMRAASVEELFKHYAARAAIATARDITNETVAALVEAAYLRLALGIEGYIAWLYDASAEIFGSAWSRNIVGLWREATTLAEFRLGPDHPDTATSLNHLANLLHDIGDHAAARPLYERALEIREKALGPGHPDTATSLNNLANLLRNIGDHAAARPLYERALAIYEKALGPDQPLTATSLNNLANLLRDIGDHAAARPLFERALEIREKALGPGHPDTATSLNNLANLLENIGDHAAARPLYERALAIDEKTLGADHPLTAISLNNLAYLLHEIGDHAAARPLYEQALAIHEKTLGPEHPQTAASLNNLARLLHDLGDHAAARPLYERALEIDEKALGPDRPQAATTLNNLANLLEDIGDHAAARPLYERALAIYEKALGPDHSGTNRVRMNFAKHLLAANEQDKALSCAELALAAHEKSLGSHHAWTMASARTTADALEAVGQNERATALRLQYGL